MRVSTRHSNASEQREEPISNFPRKSGNVNGVRLCSSHAVYVVGASLEGIDQGIHVSPEAGISVAMVLPMDTLFGSELASKRSICVVE